MLKISFSAVAAFATMSALGQNLQCPDIAKTLKEYSIDSSSSSFLNSVFTQNCQQDGSRKATGASIGLDAVVKAIPVKFTGSYNNNEEAFTNFCRSYSSFTTATSSNDAYKETISSKALDTISECQRLQASGVIVTHQLSNAESLSFYLRNSVTQTFELQGVQTTGPVKCTGQIGGAKRTFDMTLNAQITKTQSFSCIRTGAPKPNKSSNDFAESVITVLTNQGNYTVFWPKDQRESSDMASAIDTRITMLQGDLNKTNATLKPAIDAPPIAVYQCPSGTDGWNPGGQWGSYGCQGQISTDSTCINREHPNVQVRHCKPIGAIRPY